MKRLFYEFLLYVYVNHIQEDWDVYNKVGKVFIYPAWFVRSVLVWLVSPVLLLPFFVKRSKKWNEIKMMSDKMMSDVLKNNI
ncbi:MAG: hypothetical protein ACOC3V_02255 [bacterium]